MAWPPPVEGWFNFAAGATMILLAVWLLLLAFNDRVHRAFALFFFLRGVMNLIESWALLEGTLQYRVHPYFDIGVLAASLYFAYIYARRYGAPLPRAARHLPIALLMGATALSLLYAGDHSVWGGPDGSGPLSILQSSRILAYVVAAWVLLAGLDHASSLAQRKALALTSLGFVLIPLHQVGRFAYRLTRRLTGAAPWPDGVGIAGWGLEAATAVFLVFAARRLMIAASDEPRLLPILRLSFATGALATAAGVLGAFGTSAAGFWSDPLNRVMDGIFTLAHPILAGYALLRYRLFEVDRRARVTIRRGTLATIFVAAFLIASQLAENFAQNVVGQYGWVVGSVAAALLLLALAPLQRFADQVSRAQMPGVRPLERSPLQDRLDLYAEQVRLAWADGALTRKERAMLESARTRLGLPAEDALRIERDIAAM